mgnify:FL=1
MSFFIDAVSKRPDGGTTARRVGEYWTHDEAVAAARHLIDTFLYHQFMQAAASGITPEQLYALYQQRGEMPLILRARESATSVQRFDPAGYAKTRCREICGEAKK